MVVKWITSALADKEDGVGFISFSWGEYFGKGHASRNPCPHNHLWMLFEHLMFSSTHIPIPLLTSTSLAPEGLKTQCILIV